MGHVRKEVPVPQVGELPLPSGAASLAASKLDAFPQWEDLPWPKGAVPSPPVPDARGVLPFKVGCGFADAGPECTLFILMAWPA